MGFLNRLLGRQPPQPPAPASAEPAPWVAELLEQLQKLSRGNARLSLRVEDLEGKVEGGFAELRGHLAAPRAADQQRPDELFDALDALDEACVNARQLQPEFAAGLERVVRRLEQLALKQAYVRVRPHGQPPDGRLFKVVGAVTAPELADGLVARVVRAAVITHPDGSTVREGEVLTSRKEA
jgi:hypothetical protein